MFTFQSKAQISNQFKDNCNQQIICSTTKKEEMEDKRERKEIYPSKCFNQ
jgi:hypothetical protein